MRLLAGTALAALLFAVPEAWAGTTTVVLYRLGNGSSPRMDNVRAKDVAQYQHNGAVWIRHGTGGISTSQTKAGVKNEWTLPARSPYSDELLLHNDHGDHWSWEPKHDMPLQHFVDLLNQAGAHFHKLK
jgi:hypothetical protein